MTIETKDPDRRIEIEKYLADLINQGKMEEARSELLKYTHGEYTDGLAIVAATVWLESGELEKAYDCIRQGLLFNFRNYELYLLLGNYYFIRNKVDQAYLCYENAEFFCGNGDREIIRQFKENCEVSGHCNVRKAAIIILSYNTLEMTRECIESIRRNNPVSAYELIVVDNASADGSVEWLSQQEDILLFCNRENRGFPAGCNQGIRQGGADSDILLLNSDTIVFPNSLFWLRMGLYEDESVGAVGSVTNHAPNGQEIDEKFHSVAEYESFAVKNNNVSLHPYELKFYLVGFAMLIRGKALEEIGLLDTRFSPGQCEDTDLGMRLCQAGWKNMLCYNSFIYHYGGADGKNREFWSHQNEISRNRFRDKWGFDLSCYSMIRNDILLLINAERDKEIRVLEIGCGLGSTLARIRYLYPNAYVQGVEIDPRIASIGGRVHNVMQGDIETMEIPFEKGEFDYIIFADVLGCLHDPEKVLKRVKPLLKAGGRLLCSIPNIMHLSVICPLIRGLFDYRDNGVLDRSQIRFFTWTSIVRLLEECGFSVENTIYTTDGRENSKEGREFLNAVEKLSGTAPGQQFEAFQYILSAALEH